MPSEVIRLRLRADSGNTKAVFDDLGRSLLGFTIGAAGARSGLMGLGAALSGAQITGRLASAALGAASYMISSAGFAALQASDDLKMFRIALVALTKDVGLVDNLTASVKSFAEATTFSNESVYQVAQNLIAAKIPLDNLIPTLQMLGDVSLGNAEKFSGIATAWYQIMAKGKISAEEVNQIAERGVAVWQILAQETGKSTAELMKMAEAGTLTVAAYMPILQRGLAKNYAGSLKEASTLSTSLLINMGKSITTFKAAIGEGLDKAINPFLGYMADGFREAAKYGEALTKTAIWNDFVSALETVFQALRPIIEALQAGFYKNLLRLVTALTPAMYFLAAVFRGIAVAARYASTVLKPLMDTFSQLGSRIKAINWQGIWQSVKNNSSDLASQLKEALMQVITEAIDWFIKDFVPETERLATKLGDSIGKYFSAHPIEAALIVGWLSSSFGAAVTTFKLDWGLLLAGAIVANDVSEGLKKSDGGQFTQGLVEGLVGAIVYTKFGGIAAALAVGITGAIFKDLREDLAKYDKGLYSPIAGDVVSYLAAAFLMRRGEMGMAVGMLFVGAPFFEAAILKASEGDWSGIAQSIVLLLAAAFGKAALTGLQALATSIWGYFAGALIAGWGAVTSLSFWAGIGTWITGTLGGIFTTIAAAGAGYVLALIGGISLWFVGIGIAIYNGIQNGKWGELFVAGLLAIGVAIAAFFGAIPATIALFITGLALFMFELFKLKFPNSKWVTWADDMAAGLVWAVKGMYSLVGAGFTWLGEKLLAGWKWFWGIKSPSTVMYDTGVQLIQGLIDGVVEFGQNAINAFFDLTTKIRLWVDEKFTSIKDTIYNTVVAWGTSISDGMTAAWTASKAYVETTWTYISTTITDKVTGIWTAVKTKFSDGWTYIRDGVQSAWTASKTYVETTWESMKTNSIEKIGGMWTSIKTKLSEGWTYIKEGAQAAWDGSIQYVSDTWTALKEWFVARVEGAEGVWVAIKTSFEGGWTYIKDGFSNAWESATTYVAGTWAALKAWFVAKVEGAEGVWIAVKTSFAAGWTYIKDGFTSAWNSAVTYVSNTWTSIVDWFNGKVDYLGGKIKGFLSGSTMIKAITDGFQSAWDGAKSFVDNLFNGIITSIRDKIQSALDWARGQGNSISGAGGSGQATDKTAERGKYKQNVIDAYVNAGHYLVDATRYGEEAARLKYGFAQGGQFRVGGTGGPDSQMVAFRASPNETVTIRRPDQQSSGVTINGLVIHADSYAGGQEAARAFRDSLGMQRRLMFRGV